jgi:hypothetical protein
MKGLTAAGVAGRCIIGLAAQIVHEDHEPVSSVLTPPAFQGNTTIGPTGAAT